MSSSSESHGTHDLNAMTKDEVGLGKLVERLRSRKGEAITRTEKLMDEAADAITALIAERDALADKGTLQALRDANDRAEAAEAQLKTVMEAAFQSRVAQAHVALFHDDPTDIAERRDRFGEEANELQQALGQTRENAHRLVDYTYDRPAGEPEKEIGAAALTLASLCVVGGYDMMACAEADLAALVTPEKIAKVRAKRATRHGRGPLPGYDPASTLNLTVNHDG